MAIRPELQGKDCMVEAVISATQRLDIRDALEEKRVLQLKERKDLLDPQVEAKNLSALLSETGQTMAVEVRQVRSILELERLSRDLKGNLFVGFAASTDTVPHIAHLGEVSNRGFRSSQQFTSMDALSQQLMEQDRLHIFISKPLV